MHRCLNRIFAGGLDVPDRSWLRRRQFDLVIISQGAPWEGIPWMLYCGDLGVPYCVIVHSNGEVLWPFDDQLDGIRLAYSRARKVFFVSQSNRSLFEMQCGLRLENAEVVANPLAVDSRRPLPWPECEGRTNLACVGRLAPRAKGQDILFNVLAMEKWRRRPIQLNLYGTGPCRESLEALALLLGLKNVVFHGHIKDVAAIWRTNHALVLPSRFEGLPLVIVEAMLSGRPVITTAVAGNSEFVKEGISGFVAPAPTVTLFDAAMERAWLRMKEWPWMGMTGRNYVLDMLPADPVATFSQSVLALAD